MTRPVDRDAVSSDLAAGVLICLIGVAVTSVHFVPLLGRGSLAAVVLMGVVPLSLSFGLLGIGLLTARGTLVAEGYGFRFAGWVLGGMALFLVTGGWMLALTVQVLGLAAGPLAPYLVSVTATTCTLGGVIGAVIGLYDTQNRRQRRLLSEQRERLKRQNERLDEFASIVSHDLRNPLNVVALRLEYAHGAADPGDHLEKAAAALDRADELITDVLTLARRGEFIEETAPTSTRVVAETAWENVPTNGATLRIEDERTIRADGRRLEQAFENLFANSVEHGDDAVTVRVGTVDAGFYVEDDGPGLPDVEADRLFEMGYTTDEEGTGYGLAIVGTIVEAHGWSISAETGAAGARFVVETE